jgi:Predicted xylanase/chitin deacetylase
MKTIALMYHDVYQETPHESGLQNAGSQKYKVRLCDFEKQVKAVVNHCREKEIPLSRVLFTFDDGGSSFSKLIAPILDTNGLKGYFFVSTNYLGTNGFMTRDEVVDLHRKGHIIGTHSHTHPVNLSKCDERTIEQEWETSIRCLQEIIQDAVVYASLPGGYISEPIIKQLSSCGIHTVFTSIPTTRQEAIGGMTFIGRYPVTSKTNERKLTNIFFKHSYVRCLKSVKWHILTVIKSLLGDHYLRIRSEILSRM